METYKSFPDLGRSFAKMRLQDQLDAIPDNTFLGYSIRNARIEKRPLQEIAETILSQYNDAPGIVLDVVPQETINLIKQIYK